MIPLERGGARPVFRQIVDYFRRAIESGRLRPGAKLQPIRVLARELGVNRETVADAYRELETLGLTQSGVGRGTFVLPGRTPVTADDAERAARPFTPIYSRAAEATAALRVPDYRAATDAVRMERLVPDPRLYPVEEFRKALNRVLMRQGRALLDYGDPRGHEGLRRVVVEQLARGGIEAEPDDVVITGGSTQALAIVASLLCDPDDAIAVESPAYPGACATFTALGFRLAPLPLTAEGMDLDALEALLARGGVRLIYTMPSFQNPTGLATTLEHRRRLLDSASRYNVPVLEDDFQKDLRVRGKAAPSLRALDGSGRVVHITTFSKTLFPGPRVGLIVAGPRVAGAAVSLKRAMDLASSPMLQAALAQFCREGGYDRHLRRIRKELERRLSGALAALDEHLPEGSTFTRPDGGFVLWVTLPETIDTLTLLPAAKQAGVVYAPGAAFFSDGRRSSALRLSLAQAGTEEIERGIRLLGEVARAAMPRGRSRRAHSERAVVHV